jgi:hypothetical protein
MTGEGAPGLYLKIPAATGNTGENPLICPLNDHRETLTDILMEIDSDICHILREN